jgi:hypothetical protein
MSITRKYGIDLLTAGSLIGMPRFFFTTDGFTKAAREANELDFGLQLTPVQHVPGLGEPFNDFINHQTTWGGNVISFGKWLADNSILSFKRERDSNVEVLMANCLFLPTQEQTTHVHLEHLRQVFPNAIEIGRKNDVLVINPIVNTNPEHWYNLIKRRKMFVFNTYHLQYGWESGSTDMNDHILLLRRFRQTCVGRDIAALVQVQFRDSTSLKQFLNHTSNYLSDETIPLLHGLKRVISPTTPVVIELSPGLIPRAELPKTLCKTRDVIETIFNGER